MWFSEGLHGRFYKKKINWKKTWTISEFLCFEGITEAAFERIAISEEIHGMFFRRRYGEKRNL